MKYVYGKKMRTLRDRLTTGIASLVILANSAGMSLPFLLTQKTSAAPTQPEGDCLVTEFENNSKQTTTTCVTSVTCEEVSVWASRELSNIIVTYSDGSYVKYDDKIDFKNGEQAWNIPQKDGVYVVAVWIHAGNNHYADDPDPEQYNDGNSVGRHHTVAVPTNCDTPQILACETTSTFLTTDLSTWDRSKTHTAGHNEIVSGGLHIWTDDNSSEAKAAGYYPTNFPLSNLGTQTIAESIEYEANFGIAPGLQLVTDFDNDGSPDGILVGEAVYGNTWWLSGESLQFVKDNAPNTGNGYGSNWYGTAEEWLAKFPNAKVLAIGYSLGSGIHADGILKRITLGCVNYTFDLAVLGEACTPETANVFTFESANQGKRKNNTAVLEVRSNLGSISTAPNGSFYSLGFGGTITIKFNGYVANNPSGSELTIYEVTNSPYQPESASIEVSQDGITWVTTASEATNNGGTGGASYIDTSSTGLAWFKYVRITDTTPTSGAPNDADGFDLDAIVATAQCDEPQPEPEVLTSNVQVCKEDQFGARLSGWQFALLGSKVDKRSVNSKSNTAANKVTSSLAAGSYVVKASGTFIYRVTQGVSYDADARFSYRLPGDASYGGPYVPWSTSNNGLLFLNNDNTVWGTVFNPSHIYYAPLTLAAPGSAQLYIGDNQYADNVGQLTIEIFEGYTGVTDETGCVTFEDVPYGTYTVEELMQKDWENISGLGDVEVQEPEVTVTVVNRNPETPKATVLATKIVCDAESYLPNWGSGNYGPITATTVDEFLATGDNSEFCRVVEWNFQWSVDGVGNPGDNKGEINDGNWNTFASSAEIDPSEAPLIWVREVANSDYIPFTGQDTTEDVSAEFYCADDVLHYDNWEFINLQPGQTYYCVAWNVLADHSGNNEETQNPEGVAGAFTDIPSGGRGQGGPLVLGASTEGLTNTGYEVNLFAVIAGVTLGTALWINRRKPEQAK